MNNKTVVNAARQWQFLQATPSVRCLMKIFRDVYWLTSYLGTTALRASFCSGKTVDKSFYYRPTFLTSIKGLHTMSISLKEISQCRKAHTILRHWIYLQIKTGTELDIRQYLRSVKTNLKAWTSSLIRRQAQARIRGSTQIPHLARPS